jgi:hypothetical protein
MDFSSATSHVASAVESVFTAWQTSMAASPAWAWVGLLALLRPEEVREARGRKQRVC